MIKKKCVTCGEPFETDVPGWCNCPRCVKLYLSGDRDWKEKRKAEIKQEKKEKNQQKLC